MTPAQPRIKVVHLITLLEFGGAQGNTIYTVQNLSRERYDVHLWAGKGAYWDKIAGDSLNSEIKIRFFSFLIRPLNPVFDAICLLQLWSALKKLKPTILHTHSSKAGILGRLAGWMAGVPIIIHTFHGFGFNDEQTALMRFFFVFHEKIMAKLSTQLIFVSKSNQVTAKKKGIGQDNQYLIIRSGIPIERIQHMSKQQPKDVIKKSLGIPINVPVVMTIGAFKPQKNLGDFIDLANNVHRQLPDVRFVLVGDGVLRPELENKSRSLGLESILQMPGWREDATQLLSIADVFVMTSLWEGLPRSLVEAMVLGIPSICYEADGVEDLLNVNEGSLISKRDVSELTKRVLFLLKNDALRLKLGQEMKSRIGKDFEIDEMVLQQDRLYQELLVSRAACVKSCL